MVDKSNSRPLVITSPGTYAVAISTSSPDPYKGSWITVRVDRKYYYLKDHLGTIKMTVDASGNVTSYDDYYPYGMQMAGRCMVSSGDTRYKYTSKERDVETGYDYFGARYYDSRIRRWMSVDPLAEKYPAWSPYNYAADNPIVLFDPNGNWPTGIRNPLIDVAFRGDKDNFRMKEASVNADRYQLVSQSYLHAMRDGSMSFEEGSQRIEDYFAEPLSSGIDDRGYGEIMTKMHTVMDMTSPSHVGAQPWYDIDWSEAFGSASSFPANVERQKVGYELGHVMKEQTISTRQAAVTIRLMRVFKGSNGKMTYKQLSDLCSKQMDDPDDATRQIELEYENFIREQLLRQQMENFGDRR